MNNVKNIIESGKAVLGIELGSTRIKAVLIDDKHHPVAAGDHEWENQLENGLWTYSLDAIWTGLKDAYSNLAKNVKDTYGVTLTKVASIGFSAMMHGYMAFDKEGNLLVPFRTWRNGNTGKAASELIDLFHYNIPLRWSISHLYQAVLDEEEHVKDVAYFTTLAGYIHWKLTGEKVLGVGDASGMFPIDPKTKNYDSEMISKFENLVADRNFAWKLSDILPKVLVAGENAGFLTEEGAALLDESGNLRAGIPVCPPEGDAGTGMAATNSVRKRTGNVSAGTSIFSMVVLEKELSKVHPELDIVTTPDGSLVAMVHANNCTSDLNAWVNIFKEFAESLGMEINMGKIYETLYNKALEGEKDCGGLLSYGFLSGEFIAGVDEGRPLFVRSPKSRFNLANFMRANLSTALGALKVGNDILAKEEDVAIDEMYGHGGLFKTKGVGQSLLAAAINAPVIVMETAGEGGAWGIALLAAYMVNKEENENLEDYLANKVFGGQKGSKMYPDPEDVKGFEVFAERYKEGIAIELAAAKHLI